MNTQLLERIRDCILQNPESFEMLYFVDGDFYIDSDTGAPAECGTSACIAGWAVAIHDRVHLKSVEFQIRKRATEVLGITDEQADRLFFTPNWPKSLYDRYFDASIDQIYAAAASIAAERINNFIESEGRE